MGKGFMKLLYSSTDEAVVPESIMKMLEELKAAGYTVVMSRNRGSTIRIIMSKEESETTT